MDWFVVLFLSSSLSSFLAVFPALLIVLVFCIAARKAHVRHIERIKKIKHGYFCFEEE